MISKGDIIRLFNPSERGLKYVPHMHIVEEVSDIDTIYKRTFAVCTSNPLEYIKRGVPFIEAYGQPFRKKTYIRLDPIYSILDVKIKPEARTSPNHRLEESLEVKFFRGTNNSSELKLDKQEFLYRNTKYAMEI